MDFNSNRFLSQRCTFSSPSQHSLGILWSLLPFTKNLPFIHRLNSYIVVWQQLICWLVFLPSLSMLTHFLLVVHEHWSLRRYSLKAALITSYLSSGVSLLTMMTISVDRLLALLLGLSRIQTNCNFEAHIYLRSFLLGFKSCYFFIRHFLSA